MTVGSTSLENQMRIQPSILTVLVLLGSLGGGAFWTSDSWAGRKDSPHLSSPEEKGLSGAPSRNHGTLCDQALAAPNQSWWMALFSPEEKMLLLRHLLMGTSGYIRGNLSFNWNPWVFLDPIPVSKGRPDARERLHQSMEIPSTVWRIEKSFRGQRGRPIQALGLEAVPPLVGLLRDSYGSNELLPRPIYTAYYAFLDDTQVFFVWSQTGTKIDYSQPPSGYAFVVKTSTADPNTSKESIPLIVEIDTPGFEPAPGGTLELIRLIGEFYGSNRIGISDYFLSRSLYDQKISNEKPPPTKVQEELQTAIHSISQDNPWYSLTPLDLPVDWKKLENLVTPYYHTYYLGHQGAHLQPVQAEIYTRLVKSYTKGNLARSWIYPLDRNREGKDNQWAYATESRKFQAPTTMDRGVSDQPETIDEMSLVEKLVLATLLTHRGTWNIKSPNPGLDLESRKEIMDLLGLNSEEQLVWLNFLREGPRDLEDLQSWESKGLKFTANPEMARIGETLLENILVALYKSPNDALDSDRMDQAVRLITHLLENGVDVNAGSYQPFVHTAATIQNPQFLKLFLERSDLNPKILNGVNRTKKPHQGLLITHLAAQNPHPGVLKLLLKDKRLMRKTINGKTPSGDTPLNFLIEQRNWSQQSQSNLETLLGHTHFDPRTIHPVQGNNRGETPLSQTIRRGNPVIIYHTLRQAQDLYQKRSPLFDEKQRVKAQKVLLFKAAAGPSSEIFENLLSDSDIDLAVDPESWMRGGTGGENLLHVAAANPNVDIIKSLLKNFKTRLASESESIKLLLETDVNGQTPLHFAVSNKNPKVLQALIHYVKSLKGASPLLFKILNGVLSNGRAPIHMVDPYSVDHLRILLALPELTAATLNRKVMSQPERQDTNRGMRMGGDTLLHTITEWAHNRELRALRLLLKDPRLDPRLLHEENSLGKTPFDLAIGSEKEKVLSELTRFEKHLKKE